MKEGLEYSTVDYKISAITDSGTSYLILPTQVYSLVIDYLVDCCGLVYYDSSLGYIFNS